MEHLISIIRKLIQATIWILGIGLAVMLIIGGFNDEQNTFMTWAGVILLIITWFASKLISWIFD